VLAMAVSRVAKPTAMDSVTIAKVRLSAGKPSPAITMCCDDVVVEDFEGSIVAGQY